MAKQHLEHHKAWTPGLARGPRNHPEIQRFPFTDEDPDANKGFITVLVVNTLQHEYLNSGSLVPEPVFLTSTVH